MFQTKLKIVTAVLLAIASIGLDSAEVYRGVEERSPVAQEEQAAANRATDRG